MMQRSVLLPMLLFLTATAAASTAAPASAAAVRLDQAARSNDVAGARAAIADGADINARGGGGQTPIMAATLAGSADIVK